MKRVVQRILMLIMGLGIGLVLAEAACKIIDVKISTARQKATRKISRISADPDIRYELIPGVESRTPGQRYAVRVNNLGFRGPDITPEKPEGTLRIAVLGDSIAFGRTYAEDAVFPAILQALLNRDVPAYRFEVINAALSGRDTWEEAAVLERHILPLDPDIVILQICMNDHIRLPPPKADRLGAFGERPWYGYSSLLRLFDNRWPGFRGAHVSVLRALRMDGRTQEEILMDQVIRPDQMLDVAEHWEAWSRELVRIANLTRDHGAEILFVAFPIDAGLERGDEQTSPELAALTTEHEIALLDMLPFFREEPTRMLRDYTHPSSTGHYVTACEIAELLRAYLETGSRGHGQD